MVQENTYQLIPWRKKKNPKKQSKPTPICWDWGRFVIQIEVTVNDTTSKWSSSREGGLVMDTV